MPNNIVLKALAGALSGLVSAAMVDFSAWKEWVASTDSDVAYPFNWGLALKRYASGAFLGALAALGFGEVA